MSLLAQITLFATDNGEGLVGETNDKIITFFSLGLVVFFTLVVILGSAAQAGSRAPQGSTQGGRPAPHRRLVAHRGAAALLKRFTPRPAARARMRVQIPPHARGSELPAGATRRSGRVQPVDAVTYERIGAAAVLTIDRQDRRNAVDGPTADLLGRRLRALRGR